MDARSARLDRDRWHQPLVSIIVTHFNYSHHVEDALLSIVDQTYENWECVVVDDCSEETHRCELERIIGEIGSPKIRLVALKENIGQTPAVFAGMDETSGEFVSILDPDDRYAKTFLEEAVGAHLNETVYCSVVCTDQYLLMNGALISGTYTWQRKRFLGNEKGVQIVPETAPVKLMYFSASQTDWHWASTSSMMFRRTALDYLRPHRKFTRDQSLSADAYLAQGAHRLGGTLFLTKSLVYRSIHKENVYIGRVLGTGVKEVRYDGVENSQRLLDEALAAIEANGGSQFLPRPPPPKQPPKVKLRPAARAVQRLLLKDPEFSQKWKRSLSKIWR